MREDKISRGCRRLNEADANIIVCEQTKRWRGRGGGERRRDESLTVNIYFALGYELISQRNNELTNDISPGRLLYTTLRYVRAAPFNFLNKELTGFVRPLGSPTENGRDPWKETGMSRLIANAVLT